VQSVDLGAIASSLSSTIGSLREALERMSSSTSLQYSQLGQSHFEQVYVAFAGNSDLCLSLLRHCADYGEKVFAWCFPSIASPTSSRVGVPCDIRERIAGLSSETTGCSAKGLETAEGMGSVCALLRGFATHPTHGLGTGKGTPPTQHASPNPTLQSLAVSRASCKDTPDIMITAPAVGELQGLRSMVCLESGSGTTLPAVFQSSGGVYRTSIDDRQQIFGQDILPRRPSEGFIRWMWTALKDKVLVCSERSSSHSGSQT
jgi:hypothetical protein